MNKHLYKVIFNQERGQMMVVPENATAQGQSSTNTSAENPVAEPVDYSFVSGCLKPLTFSLMLMFGTAFIAETTEAANIQADKNAPKNEQPIVLQTPNGLPQVNIQTPSKAGVSVNQYRQFDVDEKGAILNNSRTNTQTQQAGWIQGNPLLATGEAKIIVNQVNSQNPSLLNGYVEVGGKRAEVILANPAGIQVNGGGFINAQSATLSTGQTLIRSGQLDQYAVHDGKISIKGKGLNAKDTDFTKIIGRYVEVDAPIAANDLTVIAGQNTVSADGKIQAAAKNTPKQKVVAIDTSELGGMYANKITLISTENNQSIDNKGQVFANAGGVTLDSQGNLSNAGTIASQGKTNIKAKDVNNSGTLSSKEQFDVKADNVDNSGTVLAANELNVRVSGSMKQTQSGNIEAARLDVETAKLDNSGTISQTGLQGLAIESTGALTNSGKIGYPEADNTAPTTANGGTIGTTAPTQNTPSSATGSGNATAVSSPSSIQNFATGNLKTRDTLNNSGTINANGGVDLTAKNGLKNTAELQLNKLAVSGNVLDNSQAKISAQSTEIQTQSVNNAQGELIASKTLNISTGQLDNRAGKLQSVDNANLTVSGSLNNQKGEIAANNALNIQDKQAQNLHIDNTDGTMVANHVSLQSKSLNNQGKLAAGNHLSIDLKDDFTVERNLEAGNKLNIKTAGSLNNSQTIQAESEVNIQAKQNISNRGTMNSNGLTRVEAGQELLNIGTGKIYGNHVALAADSVVNRDENGKAAVVAARERLDIGARKIENQEAALLSSEGDFGIGGSLNAAHQATGLADSLINGSARIEAQGNGNIAVKDLKNLNNHFKTEEYLESSNRVTAYTFGKDPTHYILGKDGTHRITEDDFYFTFTDPNKPVQHYYKGGVNNATRFVYTENKYRERIIDSKPAEIIIGKSLTISGTDWQNKDSKVLVGENITSTPDSAGLSIQNLETLENQRIEKLDAEMRVGRYGNGRRPYKRVLFDRKRDIDIEPIKTSTPFENRVSIIESNSQHTGNNQQTAEATNLNPNTGKIKSLDKNSITLPTNSLYTINPNHSGWLVETDPAFANYKQWLGSDFMLNALKTDPNHMHKRLGDGYYEQKLVNEQINRLTGYRRLDGYNNDEEQFKALMNSGITAAKEFGLSLGVSLSAEQVARLTSDIVWLETQTVTLPDGSTQTVLVPKVYVVARKGDLNTSGSLLSADKINLNIANGTLKNGGTIGARQVVAINAQDVENSGHLQADKIALQASNAILFNGGTAQADSLFSANAKDINVSSTTSSSGDKRNGNTMLDRVAAIYVGGNDNKQGNLILNAENQLNLTAAQLHNVAENGNTILQGKTVNLNTVRTENHETYGELSDKNHRHVHQTAEISSQIQTQGNIAIVGDDVAIRQGNINSANGTVALSAKNNVSIQEGRQTLDMDVSVYSKSRGVVSSTKTLDQFQLNHDEAVGSTLSGKQVSVSAGKDVTMRGANVVSDEGTHIYATENVSLTAAKNHYQDREFHETKKSGLTGSLKNGVASIGYQKVNNRDLNQSDETSLTLTQIHSHRGNTTIAAGQNLTAEAARLNAGQDLTLQGREVNLNADYVHTNTHREQERKQSGFSLGITYNPVQAAQSAYREAKQNSQFSDSAVGNIMGTADAGARATLAAAPLVVKAGSSKTQQSHDSSTTQAVRTEANAGGNLHIIATDGSIQSQGAKLSADGNALLQATHHIQLDVAHNQQSQTGEQRRRGHSIDSTQLGFLGTHKQNENADQNISSVMGTELSVGGKTIVSAQTGNVTVRGSSIASQQDVWLEAGQDVSIVSAQNHSHQANQNKSKGIGTAHISDTEQFFGYMRNQSQQTGNTVEQVRSQVGSLEGNVHVQAGGTYTQRAADVLANKDLDIQAKHIDVQAAYNTGTQTQSEKDTKIGTFASVSSPILDAIGAADSALNSKADDRTQALQSLAAAGKGYETYSNIQKVNAAFQHNAAVIAAAQQQGVPVNPNDLQQGAALLKAEAGIGFKTARSQQSSEYSQSVGNQIHAGGNARLTASEGDIRLQHTDLKGQQIQLNAANDIVLAAGQSQRKQQGTNKNYGAEVGVGASVGAQTGAYIYAEAEFGKGEHHLNETTYQNTAINAQQVEFNSGKDTTLKGANVHANRIDAKIGGQLHIESLQDSLTQNSKQTGMGGRVQGGYGNVWSADAHYNKDQTSGSLNAVNQQSGLFAGDGGYHIEANHVHLKGGAITASTKQNELNTQTLSHENIQNQRQHEVSSTGLSAGLTGSSPSFSPSLPQQDKGGDDSTTYAVLSEGSLNVGGKATTPAELGIRHQSEGAHEQLSGQVDLQAIAQQQKTVAQATSSIVGSVKTYTNDRVQQYEREKAAIRLTIESQMSPEEKAAFDKLSDTKQNQYLKQKNTAYQQADQNAQSWGTGGDKNRAVNAATTALTGILGGQSVSQVAVNTASPYAAQAIGATFSEHGSLPNGWAWLLSHGALGALSAKVNGGNAVSGAVSAVAAEAVVSAAAKELFGDKALVNGKLDVSRLTQEDKEKLSAVGALVGAASGYAVGGDTANAQVGGVVAKNAVENNSLQPNKAGNYFNQLMNNPKNEKQILAQLKKESQILTEKAKNCATKVECVELERQLQEYHYTFNQWSQSFIKNKDKISLEAKEFYEQQRKETLSDIQEVHKRIAFFERKEANSVALKPDNKSRTPLFEGIGEYEINGKKFRGTWGSGSMNAGVGWKTKLMDYLWVSDGNNTLYIPTYIPTSKQDWSNSIMYGRTLLGTDKLLQKSDKPQYNENPKSSKNVSIGVGRFMFSDEKELTEYLNKANVYETSQSHWEVDNKRKHKVYNELKGRSTSLSSSLYHIQVNQVTTSSGTQAYELGINPSKKPSASISVGNTWSIEDLNKDFKPK